ncbi:hypothetical protein K438DRAFT_1815028 [Mycena galopus ATCC 62051]|nr:hypothetical protein K438DRAFT_1815028 [Mycena galopus ATCC 62051]
MSNLRADQSSLYSYSTVPSTVWGPGTVAGRAILALGEATLRGVNRLIDFETRAIERRLLEIRRSAGLTLEMCADLIELSRPDLYLQYFQEMAMDALYEGIHAGKAPSIALSLAPIPLSEAEVIICKLFSSRRETNLRTRWSKSSIPPNDTLAEDPMLNFLALLMQLRPEVTPACCRAIDRFCNTCVCLSALAHPILRIHAEESLHIPHICRTSLSELQLTTFSDPAYRWNNWQSLEHAGCSSENRLLQLHVDMLSMLADHLLYSTPVFFDAAVDLFDFIRYSRLRSAARTQFITYISISRECWTPFKNMLDLLPVLDQLVDEFLDPRLSKFLYYTGKYQRVLSPYQSAEGSKDEQPKSPASTYPPAPASAPVDVDAMFRAYVAKNAPNTLTVTRAPTAEVVATLKNTGIHNLYKQLDGNAAQWNDGSTAGPAQIRIFSWDDTCIRAADRTDETPLHNPVFPVFPVWPSSRAAQKPLESIPELDETAELLESV